MSKAILAAAQSASVSRDVRANVSRHVWIASRAAEHGAGFILFPELSLVGYEPGWAANNPLDSQDDRFRRVQDLACAKGITIVAGAPVTFGRGCHIGAFVFSPDGDVDVYTKEFLHQGEDAHFSPGTGGTLVPVGTARIGLAICADAVHPEHARAAAQRGATCYAASCLITEGGYAKDAALLQQYATEHAVAVLMANHGAPTGDWSPAGRSAAWSDRGDLLAQAPSTGEALVVIEATPSGWQGRVV